MTISSEIILKIEEMPYSSVFTAKDFDGIGSCASISNILAKFAKEGIIRRILRGIYDKPKFNSFFNKLTPPDILATTHAIARKYNWVIAPNGNYALNILGLDTQVPASLVYHSSGPSRIYKVINAIIEFKHVSKKLLEARHDITLLIIQAMAMSKPYFTDKEIKLLSLKLTDKDKKDIIDDMIYVPPDFLEDIKKIVN